MLREELINVLTKDVQRQGEIIYVKIPKTKTKIQRSFTIEGEFCDLVEHYPLMRASNTKSDRFFLNFQNGKCTTQVIAKNKIGAMTKEIAKFLNLTDPNLYTSHTFRRTSATMLANFGADLLTLKRHGSLKSNK